MEDANLKHFAILDKNNLVINKVSAHINVLSETDFNINDFLVSYPDGVSILEYSNDNSITNNSAEINYRYDSNLNAFIPPCFNDTYILNMETFQWEPNPEVEYDLHRTGLLFKYTPSLGWKALS